MNRIHIADAVRKSLKARSEIVLLAATVVLALLVRVAIDILLYRTGYRYGDDPDTFFRTGLAWRWAIQPYFIPGHWLPLQFWINGATFAVLRPLLGGSTPLIPVVWNHVFFLGSLTLTYLFASNLGGKQVGVVAAILGATLTTDIWTTYSGLVEPMLIFFGLLASYMWWNSSPKAGGMTSRNVLLLTLGAAAASAAHYTGWFIAGFAAIALVVVAAQRRSNANGTKRRLGYLAVGVLGCLLFPIIWIGANHVVYGDGLRFLAKAQSYHDWFLVEPLRLRLSAALSELVAAEPLLIVVSFVAVPFVAKRSPGAISYLSAPAAYLLCLIFAGAMGYGVPSLHARYLLFVYWALLPFAASALLGLLNAPSALLRIGGLAVLLGVSAGGALRAFGYSNWVDEKTAAVARVINQLIATAPLPLQILVEGEPCLYPIGGLENSVSRPDWVTSVGFEDPLFESQFAERAFRQMDLVILTNPLTKERLGGRLQGRQEIGNYSLGSPGSTEDSRQEGAELLAGWSLLEGSRLVDGPEGTYFTFAEEPSQRGEAVGVTTEFTTEANACYVLSGAVQDRLWSDDWPWVLLQQVVLNGGVLWSHDVSAGEACGWNRFAEYILPTHENVEIQIRTVASPVAGFPFDWDYAALTGISDLQLATCP